MKVIFPCSVRYESDDGRSLMIESNVTLNIGWVYKDDVTITTDGLQTMISMHRKDALEKGLINDV